MEEDSKENSKENNKVIELKHLFFYYNQPSYTLKDVSFDVYSGETIGIIGANGAGKSTLLKLFLGLLIPEKGSIQVCNIEVKPKNLRKVREKIGYTFQEPDNQLFMPTVFDDIAFSSRQKKLSEDDVKKIVNKALTQVDGLHLMNKSVTTLSGGEKRVVTLATVLASEPEILILDEPSVGLDPRSRRNLISLLSKRKETKLIATHDMDMALELCDRIIVLYNGEVHAIDVPKEIFKNETLLEQNHLEQPLCMQKCSLCQIQRKI